MEKMILDELDFYENLEEVDELFSSELLENEIDFLFNNECANQKYIVCGTIGLWDGIRRGYSPYIANSIKEAIYNGIDGFSMCYITIYEGNHGRLYLDVCHHDGSNHLEIREITKKGEKILNNNFNDVGSIVNSKGATRNVKYFKKYW